MRKLIGAVCAAAMAQTLVACGGGEAEPTDTSHPEDQQEQVAEGGEDVDQASPEQTAPGEADETSSADFRATMDAYEAFINEYCDFMEKYQSDPSNAASLMADYASMMSSYADMTEQIEAIDTESLSAEDLAYYTEVMARVAQRLAEVGQ